MIRDTRWHRTLILFLERSRILYILLHLEPNGLRYTIIGHILFPLFLGAQFILVPDERWHQSIFIPITDLVPIDTVGVIWLLFGTWMLYISRFVRTAKMGYLLTFSAIFYVFWASIFAIASYTSSGTGFAALFTATQAWSLFSVAQSFIYKQTNVNGPRSEEFK